MTRLRSRSFVAALLLAATAISAAPPTEDVSNRADIEKHFDRNASVRVLNVWATWCAPCAAEMPDFEKIHDAYRSKGVSLVALSMDDALPGSRDEARKRVGSFVATHKLSFPTVLYVGAVPDIEAELDLPGEIPVTIVFDRHGHELKRIEGIIDATAFRTDLDRILDHETRTSE